VSRLRQSVSGCIVADRGGGGGGGGGGRRPLPTNSVRSQPTPSAPVDLAADTPVYHDGVLKANVSWAFDHGTYGIYAAFQWKTVTFCSQLNESVFSLLRRL